MADDDRAIRMKTLQVLGVCSRGDKRARALLEVVALGQDPVLAVAAKALLR